MTIFDVAEKFPPCLCRCIARKKHGYAPMSVRELAEKSGLSKSRVAELSLKRSWKGIPIDTISAFSLACGVDLMRPHDTIRYLRKSKRAHLERATKAQREFFLKLFTLRE